MAFICISFVRLSVEQVECKKAQPKEVMFPPGTRGRARGLPYTMDAFMLGMGMLGESRRDPGDTTEPPCTGGYRDLNTQLGYLLVGQTAFLSLR